MTNKLESAKAAHRAAKEAFHQEWLKGESEALKAAEAHKEATWLALCAASRKAAFSFEEGAFKAHQHLSQLALDDA